MWDQEIYAKAWRFASMQHQGQSYGGVLEGERIDYLTHLGSVAMEIMWALQHDPNADGNLALQCAILHDTLEDTAASHALLVANFGQSVADGVAALTKNTSLPDKAEQMQDSLQRIKLQSREIGMVKLADRISNLEHPPFYWDNPKILSYRDEAVQILHALAHCNSTLAARLARKIEAYPGFLRQ